jgi:hypothetical protein
MGEWLDESRIAYPSRVLPIGKSVPNLRCHSLDELYQLR